jgi:hypothetical protein
VPQYLRVVVLFMSCLQGMAGLVVRPMKSFPLDWRAFLILDYLNYMLGSEIDFFKSLSQLDYSGQYYDFHNDFDCEGLSFSSEILTLNFRNTINFAKVSLVFSGVNITKSLIPSSGNVFTIDNLYRGRYEDGLNLLDISADGKAYFYLEFCDGQQFEFWAYEFNVDFAV